MRLMHQGENIFFMKKVLSTFGFVLLTTEIYIYYSIDYDISFLTLIRQIIESEIKKKYFGISKSRQVFLLTE